MKAKFTSSVGFAGLIAGLLFLFLAAVPQEGSAQPLTGIKTVGPVGDYLTIAAAVADLNINGVGTGGVTFNVAAGHVETAPVGGILLGSAALNATTSATTQIVFQKSGAGANPVINAFIGTSTTVDGIFFIRGTDYVTIDGIDLMEDIANTTNTTKMEFGYALVKLQNTAPFDGCQFVTIQNCNITLDKVNPASKGIYSGNHIATATTSLTLTAVSDAMLNCSFISNNITNSYVGISLNGSSNASYYDLNTVINGNQITNFGGGSSTAYGIYTIYHGDITVNNNTVIGGNGTTTTLYGLFFSTATSRSATISGNTITVISGATTSALYGISNAIGSTAAGNTVNISNNLVHNCDFPTATTGLFHAIVNSATAAVVNIFNNTINNNVLPGTGAFIGISNTASMGTNPVNIYGNTISNINKTGTSGILYGCQATTATVSFYQNNVFNLTSGGGASALYGYYNVGSPVTENYYSNNIYNLTHLGTGTISGIQVSTALGTKTVHSNNIYNLTGGGTVNGYASAYGSPTNFYGNNIYNLTTTGTSSVVTGITYSGTNGNIYNNFISDLKATQSTNANAVIGINITGGTTHTVYYNTVYLDAISTSTSTFGTSAIYLSTSPNVTLANNIAVNLSVPGPTGGITAALRFSSSTLTSFNAASNNNCFYAGSPGASNLIFTDGTNSDQTLVAFKSRVAPRENVSISELPPFVNITIAPFNLHLQTTVGTQCESGGKLIAAVTEDFDGEPRFGSAGYAGTGTAPDIGADEGNFVALDLTPPNIAYTPLGMTTVAGTRILKAKITDASGISQSGPGLPVLYWQANAGPWNAATGIYLQLDTFEFSFGGTTLPGDVVRYFIVAQDMAPTPNVACFPLAGASGFSVNPPAVSTPPANPSFYVIQLPLTGIKTINNLQPTGGGNYTNFQDAVDAINLHGIGTGGVTFHVYAGQTFNAAAVAGQNFGLQITGTGTASDPILFTRFGAGSNPQIMFTGTSATNEAGLWLFGSDYITFDGIDLKDAGTSASDYIEYGLFLNGSATNGSTNITFKNGTITLNKLNGNSKGVYVLGSNATSTTGAHHQNKFYNNKVQDAAHGYHFLGAASYYGIGNEVGTEGNGISSVLDIGSGAAVSVVGIRAQYMENMKIFNTQIQNLSGSSTTYPTTAGIFMINCLNAKIYGNTIMNLVTTAGDPVGINFESITGNDNAIYNNIIDGVTASANNINSMRLFTGTGITLHVYNNQIMGLVNSGSGTSNGIYCSYTNSNIHIYNNKINDFHNSGSSANIIYGIYLSGSGNTYVVYNNMVYNLRAPASTGTAPAVTGIWAAGSICRLFHNTVLLDYVSTASANTSAAIYATTSATLLMQNNIFINKTDVTTGARASAFLYNSTSYSNIQTATNNNIYYTGANPAATNPIFFNGTTAYATLADYQTHVVNFDQASLTENVPFVSSVAPYNLHIMPVATFAESNGIKIVGVDTDIDGEIRAGLPGYIGSGLFPDIGADEFNGIAIFTCTTPTPGNTVASSTSICLGDAVTLSLQNPTPGTGVGYQWESSLNGTTWVAITGAIASQISVNPQVPTWFRCIVTCYNGPVTGTSVPVQIDFASQILSTTNATRCGTGSVTLQAIATPGADISWYNSPSGGASIGTGTSFTTPVISTSTDYYAAATTGSVGNVGPLSPAIGTGASSTIAIGTQQIFFNVLSPTVIYSVDVFPTAAIGSSFTIVIQNSSGTPVFTSGPHVTTVTGGATPQTVVLNASLAPGTGYRFGFTTNPGMIRNSTGGVYPYTIPGVISITGNSFDPVYYYFFYNWVVGTSCSSPRALVTATVTPAPAINATITPAVSCAGDPVTLNVTSSNPDYTYTWTPGNLVGAQQIVNPTTSTVYTVNALDQSGLANNGCAISAQVSVQVDPVPAPVSVIATTPALCPGEITQLTAVGGTMPSAAIIGNGTIQNGTSGYPSPYGQFYTGEKSQYLILASELTAAGVMPGPLTAIAFDVVTPTLPTSTTSNLNGYTVKVGSTNTSSLGLTWETGLTTVFTAASYPTVTGWNSHPFSVPFIWDGTSNIVIETCFDNYVTASDYSANAVVNQTATPFTSVVQFRSDGGGVCNSSAPNNTYNQRPNIRVNYSTPITIAWTPQTGLYTDMAATIPYSGQSINTVYAMPAGTTTYTATATNSFNCTASGSETVVVYPVLTADAGADVEICDGSSTMLNATGIGGSGVYTSYQWSPSAGLSDPMIMNPIVSPAVTTTYTVHVIDQNGCHANDEVIVTVLPLPTLDAGMDAHICYGDAIQLNAIALGGSGIFTSYAWSPATGLSDPTIANPVADPLTTTTYHVTVTDNKGCQAHDMVTVTVNPMLTVDAGVDQSTCAGMMVFLNATPAGGSGSYSYVWSPAATLNDPLIQNPEATPWVTTVYTVTVYDLFGCSASDDVEIVATALPVANAGADVSICFGQTAQLQASGGTTYQWSPTYGLSNPNIANPVASPPVTTTYTVTVTSICGVASDDVVVTVRPLPTVMFMGLPSTVCVNASTVTLTGSPAGGTFSGPGVVGNTFNPALAGVGGPYAITYSYTAPNNCTNTSTANVTVTPIPAVPVIGYIPSNLCIDGAPYQLVGVPAGGVFSGPGVVGNQFNPSLAGVGAKTITYTVAGTNGCTNSNTKVVNVQPLPIVSFTGLAASYCADQAPVTLTGNPAGGFFSGTGMSGNSFRPIVAGPGTYTITYQYNDAFGCVNTSSQVVTVHPVPTVSFVGLQNEYCINVAPVTLVGNMGGSNFSGTGVLGNTFNPAVAGLGYTTITYTYTNPATGCTNSVTSTVLVRPTTAVQIVAPANACINGTPVTLLSSPTGGTFSGTGVTGNQFNPVTAGLGTKVITYTFTNSYGCVSSTTHNITVQPLTTTTIGGLSASYCIPSTQTVALAGFPAGGTFSGPGMSGNTFNPQAAGTGTKVITYTAADMYGCVNSTTATTVVNSTVASFTGLASNYCLNSAPVTLTGSTAGSTTGTFIGAGMNGNVFNPTNAGVGGHTINYTLTNPATGCTGVASQYVVVHAIPVVSILNLSANQCINGAPTAVITSPATGGTLSGPGITGNTFNPATAGLGTHTITYSYTNANNCTVIGTQTVTVHALTSVSFNGLDPTYCEKDPVALLSPVPAGGIFSGPGMYGTAFRPWVAGAGNHTIVYTYKDANGCTNTASQPVTVLANPVVNLGPDQTICINNVVTLDAGAGHTSYLWSTGETTQTIQVDGAFWKPGFHYFTVTVTNANGCASSDIVRVVVSACTGIDDNVEITQVEVYPNPSDGLVNLLFNNFEGSYKMTILNDLGQVVMAENLEVHTSGRFVKQIDLTTQPTGMYFIRLMNESTSKVVKVIIH